EKAGVQDGAIEVYFAPPDDVCVYPALLDYLDTHDALLVYEINGPLFFAATDKLLDLPRDDGLKVLILRASNLQYMDSSAIHSLEKLVEDAKVDGVTLIFSHIHAEPLVRLQKAGLYDAIGEENFCHHIDEALARAEAILAEEAK
ncbi:MAG: STAS domain-containing protein, partial [Clostridia bacterium]|nr:STAS domain-containing protein [Clostridia bacterium]